MGGAGERGYAEDPAVPDGGVPEKDSDDQAAEEPLELPVEALDFEPEEPEPDDPEPDEDDEDPVEDVDADLESDDDEPDDLSLEPLDSPEPFDAPALAGVLLDDEPRLSFR
ncbi:hypothetical protein SSPS47_13425 [Streptomyces sp. S4.7]|nr:hypothetical protein SSPS47_13425 [Streptomyces sp. S4.7]